MFHPERVCEAPVHPSADHFSRVAQAYAGCRPSYPVELFIHLASLPARRDLAWDCGAGSGQAAVPLTRYFARVIATDISAAQLAAAPARQGLEYRVAAAETSGLSDRSVDLVAVAQALHWFDVQAFYAEVARVLAPGGILAAWSYGSPSLRDEALDPALRRFMGETVGPFWPPERRHVESGYRTLPFPFDEMPSPALEMWMDWTLDELLGYVRTWSACGEYLKAKGSDPVALLANEMMPLWGPPERRRRVWWPLAVRIGGMKKG